MTDQLLEHLDGGVLTLTLNRPERLNTLTPEMSYALERVLLRAAEDREIGAIVLTGAGRAFCAGGDVKSMAAGAAAAPSFDERVTSLRRRMEPVRLLHEIAKPTIAMLRGAVAGAGLSLALACDLRIASEDLRLTTAFVKVGLSSDFGGSYLLTRLVGGARARELFLTSPRLTAHEALAQGVVTRVVADAALETETLTLARSLADGPRIALGYMKQNLTLAETASLAEVMDAEALRHIRCAGTEDHREAAAAFVAKRPAKFRGR